MNEKFWSEEDKRIEKQELACDILDSANVMQVFDDAVWLFVSKDKWDEYNGNDQGEVK